MTRPILTISVAAALLAGAFAAKAASSGKVDGAAALALAGVPSEGAAGSIFESLTKLDCTLDPAALKDKGGGGAACSYGPAN